MDQKNLANDIWQVAELLRGYFKQSEYGLVILPFTVQRRLECVLEPTRDAVVERAEQIRGKGYDPFPLLTRASGVDFYNTSSYSLGSLGLGDTRSNLLDYLDRFSPNVHAIFEQFEFTNKIDRLEEDKWVLGEAAERVGYEAQLNGLERELHRVYQLDFTQAWTTMIDGLRIANLSAGAPNYEALAAAASPSSPAAHSLLGTRPGSNTTAGTS